METNDVIYLQEGSIVRTEKTYDNDVAYFSEEKVMDLLTTIFHSDRAEEILKEMKGGKE